MKDYEEAIQTVTQSQENQSTLGQDAEHAGYRWIGHVWECKSLSIEILSWATYPKRRIAPVSHHSGREWMDECDKFCKAYWVLGSLEKHCINARFC